MLYFMFYSLRVQTARAFVRNPFFLAKRLKEIYLYTILTFIVKNCFVFTVLFLLSTKKGPGRLVIVNWHATLWALLRGHPR